MHRPAPELLPGRSLRPRLESGNHRERTGRVHQVDRIESKNIGRRDPHQESACNKAIEKEFGAELRLEITEPPDKGCGLTQPISRRHVATEHENHVNSSDSILGSHQKPTQVAHQDGRTRAGILSVLFPRAQKEPRNSDSRRPQRYFLRGDVSLKVHPKTWCGCWSRCWDGKRLNPAGAHRSGQ